MDQIKNSERPVSGSALAGQQTGDRAGYCADTRGGE